MSKRKGQARDDDFVAKGKKYQRVEPERRSPRNLVEKKQSPITTITIEEEEEEEKKLEEMNPVELYEKFTQQLKGQDATVGKLTAILYAFMKKPLEKGKKRIAPILLSGVSGMGKTKTVEILKEMLDLREEQYVYFPLTKITDETQVNQILGAGPGLLGSDSDENIPMKLLRAIGRTPPPSRNKNEADKTYVNRMLKIANTWRPPPETILLHFEELDKAHPKFLQLFLNFFEDGILSSSTGKNFVLPDETRLIVLFSANYADVTIEGLSPHFQYNEAKQAIENDMEDDGVPLAAIGRFGGNILPYFKLDQVILKDIKTIKLKNAMNNTPNGYQEYIHSISYLQEELDVIETIIPDSNPALGVRAVYASVTTFMNNIYYELTTYIIKFMPQVKLPLKLNFSHQLYDVWQYDDLTILLDLPESKHTFKSPVIERIREKMSDRSDISLLTVMNGKEIIHAILVEEKNKKEIQLYQPTMERKDMNLIVNIKRNRMNKYEITAHDDYEQVKPLKIDYGFNRLYALAIK